MEMPQLVGVLGAVAALITALVGIMAFQAGKTSAFHSAFYVKRMEIYDEIVQEAIVFYDAAVDQVAKMELDSPINTHIALSQQESYKRFTNTHRKWAAYLTEDVSEAIINLKTSFMKARREDRNVVILNEPSAAYKKLIATIRKHLGTDELAPALLEAMSKPYDTLKDE